MLKKIFFSPSTVGFYTSDDDYPDDATEVSEPVEVFLRRAVVWGADSFIVEREGAFVSYPDFMREYAMANNAPLSYPENTA